MSLNGEIIRLTAGEYAALVTTAGATLASLSRSGHDLVLPFDPLAGVGVAYQGRTLVPWPNRVASGRFAFGGAEHQLPVNEPATGSALHGLALWLEWPVLERGDDHVAFALDLPASDAYPWDVLVTARYQLAADAGLTVTVTGTNQGTLPLPYGASSHPYLTCDGASVDACTLELPAARVLLVDDRLVPTHEESVDGTRFDLRRPTALAGVHIDHALTGLPEGGWRAVLTGPGGLAVTLTADAPWLQLYTGENVGRRGVALEPMTCGPDAFNREPGSVALAPGETRTLAFTIGS